MKKDIQKNSDSDTLIHISVSSTEQCSTSKEKAHWLSRRLSLAYAASLEASVTEYVLVYTKDGLQLVRYNRKKGSIQRLLHVDFLAGKNRYRRKNDLSIHQPLAKAAGMKPGFRPTILDATAGLGKDGFLFASLGCQLTLCERNPILFALLEDGLLRAQNDPCTRDIVERIRLIQEDSILLIKQKPTLYDTVYLDPMYPQRTSSALNKQELRVIRQIVGDDRDVADLFAAGKQLARHRVVVKRPRLAPPLTEEKISYQIQMTSCRYDIYLIPPQRPVD